MESQNELLNNIKNEIDNNIQNSNREELRKKLRQKINSKSYMRNSNNVKKNIKQDTQNIDNVAIQQALKNLSSTDPKIQKQLKKKLGNINKNDLFENINNVRNELLNELNDEQKTEYLLKTLFKDGNPTLNNQQKIKKDLHNIILNQNNNPKIIEEKKNNNNIDDDEFENLEEIGSDDSSDEKE